MVKTAKKFSSLIISFIISVVIVNIKTAITITTILDKALLMAGCNGERTRLFNHKQVRNCQ